VGGWSAAADAAATEAGFKGGVADGGAGVVRGCSGGVARNVTASRCEAEGTRDSVTREARRAGDAVEAGGTPGTVGTGGVPDETTAAGFADGAPGVGVFVSAGFSIGDRAGSGGAEVICAVGISDEAKSRWVANGRGGIVGGFDAAGSSAEGAAGETGADAPGAGTDGGAPAACAGMAVGAEATAGSGGLLFAEAGSTRAGTELVGGLALAGAGVDGRAGGVAVDSGCCGVRLSGM
jgi:hypothetical protein